MISPIETDVLVVGGGLAGLTAATIAATEGAKTLVLEAATTTGGRARTREQHGFYFNQGPHALYLGGAAKRTLDRLGIDPPGGAPLLPNALVVRHGKFYPAPPGLGSTAQSLMMSAVDHAALTDALSAIGNGFSGLAGEPLTAALARLTSNALARDILNMLVRLTCYANAPAIASADAVFDQMRLVYGGVRYLDHGWSTMVNLLAGTADAAGVRIDTGIRIVGLEARGGAWSATRADGIQIHARSVVLAMSPQEAADLAPMEKLKSAARSARRVCAASLEVGLSSLPEPTHTFALGIDSPVYLSVHSIAAKLAPAGSAMIHVAKYLEVDERPSHAVKEELEALLDLLQPGWRACLKASQWLPSSTVVHDFPQAASGGSHGRCPVSIAPNLFVAGDWVGSEGMLSDTAFASGVLAGELAAHSQIG